MKSLERLANKIKEENPCWSDYLCFVETIQRRKFSERTIRKYFSKLVDKNEFNKRNKKDLLKYLMSLSTTTKNSAEGG